MQVIGLIGQTGAGKSHVSALLQQAGMYIVDGDRLARAVTAPGSPVLAELATAFGADILLPDGSLDRKRLAARAFRAPAQTRMLNAITHPAITQLALTAIKQAEAEGYTQAVFEGAALLESPLRSHCDCFIAVVAPKETRLARVMQRDGLTQEEAALRMGAQQEDAYYCDVAVAVVRNYPPFDLHSEVKRVVEQLQCKQKPEEL